MRTTVFPIKKRKIWTKICFECQSLVYKFLNILTNTSWCNGYGCVMVIVVGNGHSEQSSNPGRGYLHFT